MKKLPKDIKIDYYVITKNDKVVAELPWFADAVVVFRMVCDSLASREVSFFYAVDVEGKYHELDRCYYIEEF